MRASENSARIHEWINSAGVLLSLLLTLVFGVCTLQSQEKDRQIASANRLRDFAAQQSALKGSVLRFDSLRVVDSRTEVEVVLRVANAGGGPTTLTSVDSAGLTPLGVLNFKEFSTPSTSFFASATPRVTGPDRAGLEVSDPPAPSHALSPAPRLESRGVVDISVRVTVATVARTVQELAKFVEDRHALSALVVTDVLDQSARVILWDCGPRPFDPQPCSGPLFQR